MTLKNIQSLKRVLVDQNIFSKNASFTYSDKQIFQDIIKYKF